MKFFLPLTATLLILSIFATALGDSKRVKSRIEERERIRHIYRSRPHRLDEPLREDNISDGEIREIQVLTDERYPGAIANIGGVTSGCPCEEGPDCDSQVWILAHRDDRYDGLLLSRVNSKWTIGSIQQWWFKYDQFQKRAREARAERKPESRYYYSDYLDELRQLQDAFPSCLVPEQDLQVQDGVEPRN